MNRMKQLFIAIALISAVFVLGCVNSTTNSAMVQNGDNVSVEYTGMLENGTVFDSSVGRAPLIFTAGSGQLIRGFDDAVIGMHVSDEKNVTIPPQDAYGFPDPAKIINVSVDLVPNGTKAGDTLYSGNIPVRVINVTNDTVFIDANNPLAGKTLVFRIRILNITKGIA